MIRSLFLLSSFCLGLISGSVASVAATIPANFILEKMAKTRASQKKIEWVAKVSDAQAAGDSPQAQFEEWVQIDWVTAKIKIHILDGQGQRIFSVDKSISQVSRFGQVLLTLSYDMNLDRMHQVLRNQQLNPKDDEMVKLTRLEQRPVWQWGTGDEKIQIEKDLFLLAGFEVEPVESSNRMQWVVDRFSGYGTLARYPKLARLRLAGQDRFLFELQRVKTNGFSAVPAGIQRDLPESWQEWLRLVR